jgi:hypothetical protein
MLSERRRRGPAPLDVEARVEKSKEARLRAMELGLSRARRHAL